MNNTYKYTEHAFKRMFERSIQPEEVELIVNEWNIISKYLDDSPFPSFLLLGFINKKPIHVVVAVDSKYNMYYIITVYRPSLNLWSDNFTRRKK